MRGNYAESQDVWFGGGTDVESQGCGLGVRMWKVRGCGLEVGNDVESQGVWFGGENDVESQGVWFGGEECGKSGV